MYEREREDGKRVVEEIGRGREGGEEKVARCMVRVREKMGEEEGGSNGEEGVTIPGPVETLDELSCV